ncbi:hypothetical protein RRG08_025910 [Elysia crispata]|uniref:Uncharacterized protein n=1 Tax=Elysia crispata TaxID=231223 RepID=A0AAE1AGL1_9GAST|nr:hypothetical protein RRG08_025910 [Elysia crispata]
MGRRHCRWISKGGRFAEPIIEMTAADLLVSLAFCLFTLPLFVGARQMCYNCGFQGGIGPACIDDPRYWKNGDPHVKCEFDCVINSIFNSDTGEPTFVYRSCQKADRDDGCEQIGNTLTCFFSCNGKDYCNDRDLSRSPELDGASILTPLSPRGLLLNAGSLCAVFIFKLAMERMYG